jgi:hypothetical protein
LILGILLRVVAPPCVLAQDTADHLEQSVDVFQEMQVEASRGGVGDPIIQPRPNVGWEDGRLVAATDSRFQLSNTASHARDLRTQWQGSLVFENNERERTWEDIQKGDLRMVLTHPRGDQFFANFRGTTDVQVLGSGVIVKPTSRLALHGFAQETIQLQSWGRSQTTYFRVQADVRLTSRWRVQPAVYRIDARARDTVGWTGVNLFTTWRRTNLRLTWEGSRSDRTEILHSQPLGRWTLRVGTQWARWMDAPHRHLLQWGVSHGQLGVDVYRGTDQLALLLQCGRFAVGQSWTSRGVQRVVGVHHVSFWTTQTPQGSMDIGVGFAFHGLLRRFAKSESGWSSFAPLHRSALATPHVRWPGFGSTL